MLHLYFRSADTKFKLFNAILSAICKRKQSFSLIYLNILPRMHMKFTNFWSAVLKFKPQVKKINFPMHTCS